MDMALAFAGIVLFSIGACVLVGDKNHGLGAVVVLIGLIVGLIGITEHPGSGVCNADGHCDHTHGAPYTP